MRKPRDYDAELKALDEKARTLRTRRLTQLGELVIATGADALPVEVLTGALLCAAEAKQASAIEEWRRRGAEFFREPRRPARRAVGASKKASESSSGTLPFGGPPGAG